MTKKRTLHMEEKVKTHIENVLKDYINKKFERITIKSYYSGDTTKNLKFLCVCDCGKEVIRKYCTFYSGRRMVKSCGCYRAEYRTAKNKVGLKSGKLTVVAFSHMKNKRSYWLCKCECGNDHTLAVMSIGKTTSCGCNRKGIHSLPKGEANFNIVLYNYKGRAKKRGLKFELTIDEFKLLISSDCYYCGSAPNSCQKASSHGNFIYNGIDRINSNEDYIKENTVTCCGFCNRAKYTYSQKQFLDHIKKVYEFNKL